METTPPFSPCPAPGFGRLVAGVRAGDDAAATELVEVLYPTVIRIVRSHLPRSAQEEDVAQDVFLKVFSKIDQYRGESPFDHWVSRIATNTCFDLLRRQKVRPLYRFSDLREEEVAFLENATSGLDGSSEYTDPATRAAGGGGELARELLDRLLATLNAREQLVIRLLDLEENSVEEICNRTGWGASKVKVTAMRARKKLTRTLEKLEVNSAITY
jgi:RNA polymerase sigma-70 factor (ECF subfamily)